ncbi:MAG: hypothetical protein ACLTDR_04540 [Adlercreutzia equolifaciens]
MVHRRRGREALQRGGAWPGSSIPDWDDYKAEFQKNGWFDSKVEKPEAWGTYRRYQVGTNAVNGDFPPLPPEAQHQGWNTTTPQAGDLVAAFGVVACERRRQRRRAPEFALLRHRAVL